MLCEFLDNLNAPKHMLLIHPRFVPAEENTPVHTAPRPPRTLFLSAGG